MLVSRLAAALGAAGVWILALAATPAFAGSEFYGIAQTATLNGEDMQEMRNAHVHTNRFILNWGWVESGPGNFRWGPADRFIGELAAHGIRAVPSVWGNPSWVAGSSSSPPVGAPVMEAQWRNLLKALVGRYGPGGVYWRTFYHQQFGAGAKPLPITSWQIWNEPNLKKFFAPYPSPGRYARLLQISYPTIKARDPHAQVVLGGMPGYGDVTAWQFLGGLYSVPGVRAYFDATALHPYARDLTQFSSEVQRFRSTMKARGDAATPLWISEIAWGSAPPDKFGINKGLTGQAQLLRDAFKIILGHRAVWNVQRVFWYHWRDPRRPQASCSFCGSAGLLRFDRTPKPALAAFKSFSAETTPPTATITGGPAQGGLSRDATPTFRFVSSEAGSTFLCRIDARQYSRCSSPYTPQAALAEGPHSFRVKALDAVGNVSAPASRSFTVDTIPPPAPKITGTNPTSPANENHPKVMGNASPGSIVRLYTTADCSGTPTAKGSAATFETPGLTVTVPDNSTTTFRATAVDAAGNASACSAPLTYVEDSTP